MTPVEIEDFKEILTSFGVGCFYFKMRSGLDNINYTKKYRDEVINYPEGFPIISKIDVSEIHSLCINIIDITPEENSDYDITVGPGLIPWPSQWHIRFKLNIPSRVAADIMARFGWINIPENAEIFDVYILYNGDFPVTFIRYDDFIIEQPSMLLILLREYFKKYDQKNTEIDLFF
jgi:hypothetical protein